MDQAKQAHLQVHPRIWLVPQILIGLQKNIEESRQVLFAELRGGFRKRGPLVGSRRNQVRFRAANPRNQEVAHVSNRLTTKMLQVAAFFLKGVDESERAVR